MTGPGRSKHDLSPFDVMLDERMQRAVAAAGDFSPALAGMISYHLGWVDQHFASVDPVRIDRGKRIRPRLATLTCRSVCGSDAPSLDLAAGIELLHNFTLVHDDIQDESHLRRHRPTVWSIWGSAQAINTGDAMYAASRRALLGMSGASVPLERTLAIADAFDMVAIEIVAGQVTDLEFEGGQTETVDDYLRMIGMKTAAIVRFAAWAGAYAGGASGEVAEAYGRFGWAIGLGFQIRDDILGIWGTSTETGKPAADDLRRKKQSLPVIEFRSVASEADRRELERIYAQHEVTAADIETLLNAFDRYSVRRDLESIVQRYHDDAEATLDERAADAEPQALGELRSFVKTLSIRTY